MTSPLRRLDDRLVPRLAEFFDRVFPRAPEPTGPLPVILRLRRVDDRWTQRGPLALVREVPQLGALVIAALVLASGITVANRSRPEAAGRGTEQGTPAENGDDRLAIGPQLGDAVPAYVDATRERMRTLASLEPARSTVAVVSFGQYRTARQVADLVGEAAVVRIFYRPSKLTLTEAPPADIGVTDLLADAKKEFLRVAIRKEAEAAELIRVSSTIGDSDPAQKAEQQKDAALYLREAQQLRSDCACIYAVVVQAPIPVLAGLVGRPGVRAVDPGAPGARTADYESYTALLPEEKVTVTGGNQE
ncbi:MAG TPA: hypothetical protein VGX28_07600 [Frankiaceae bacterium]|nr:hypothetical protein [Frankiaceae bacterium]